MRRRLLVTFLVIFFSAILLFSGKVVFADTTNNLSLTISPNGDVPAVTVACTIGHNYTLALIYESDPNAFHSLGILQRYYCMTGMITFSGFNMNNLLNTQGGSTWWQYIFTPLSYIIKDTTGLYGCSDPNVCNPINEEGAFNNYDHTVEFASSTYWPTLAAGPKFDTNNYIQWFNAANGDGSGNVGVGVGDSNVLFLPGIEASRLYEADVVRGEDKLWEPPLFTKVSDLYLNSSGQSINHVYTKDIIDNFDVLGLLKIDVYQNLISNLNNLASTTGITWVPYAYDWRQGIDDLVNNGTPYQNGNVSLITTLQNLVNASKNGKVTIIAHSNGGLLAKDLIKKLEDMKSSGQNDLIDHIDTVVMIGTPQIGTASALSGLLDGYNQSIPLGILLTSQARDLAVNMSSAYGLLPSSAYFAQSGIMNPASFSSSTPQIFINKYGSSIDSYSKEHNFIIGAEGRSNPTDIDTNSPLIGNTGLLAQAETLHNTIDNMTFPTSIKVIDIAGWGKDTVSSMTYGNDTLDPIFTDNGDGVVVDQSAMYGIGTKYWLDLTHSKLDHKQIMEDPQILSFIDNIIGSTGTTTLSQTEPIETGNRLHLSVHSPVSIGITDNQGNFTGNVCDDSGNCTVEENIPGSTYLEFGEGKYVNLGQGDFKSATLQGLDTGTFTFDYSVVAPNGSSTVQSFQNIPVTPQLQATITTNATSSAPQLALDVDGDGKTDFTLTPNNTFDPVTYLQVMEATINSLDLTQAKIKAFDNRVDTIIKLIQKGKIDKAKLKADNFVTVLQNKLAKPDSKKPKPKKLSKTDAQTLLDLLNGLLDNLN